MKQGRKERQARREASYQNPEATALDHRADRASTIKTGLNPFFISLLLRVSRQFTETSLH